MTYNALGTLKSLMRLTGFFDPKQENRTQKFLLTLWSVCIALVLSVMSAQCITQLILDENRDVGKTCYVISVTGLLAPQKKQQTNRITILVLGVVFGGILQITYVSAKRNKILKLFELIELNFEYASQTGLQEIDMKGYNKKALLMIYWWVSVIVVALVFVLAGPLAIQSQRFASNRNTRAGQII